MNKTEFITLAKKHVEQRKADGFAVEWSQQENARFFAKVITALDKAGKLDADTLVGVLHRAGNASANRQVLEAAGVLAKSDTSVKTTATVSEVMASLDI